MKKRTILLLCASIFLIIGFLVPMLFVDSSQMNTIVNDDSPLQTKAEYSYNWDTSNYTTNFTVDSNMDVSGGNFKLKEEPLHTYEGQITTWGAWGGAAYGGGDWYATDNIPGAAGDYFIGTCYVFWAWQGWWSEYTAVAPYYRFTEQKFDGYFDSSGGIASQLQYWERWQQSSGTYASMMSWSAGGAYNAFDKSTYNHLSASFNSDSYYWTGSAWRTKFQLKYFNNGGWYPVATVHAESAPYYKWLEYYDNATIESGEIDLGSTMKVNNITLNGFTTPGDGTRGYSNYDLEIQTFYGGVWSNWIPISTGGYIGTAASKIKVRVVLQSDSTYHYYTSRFDSISVNFEDPPVDQPPLFSFPMVDPDPPGYNATINASVMIETFTPLIEAYVNWTNNSWANWYRVNLSDTINISGFTRWSGDIDGQKIGTNVQYYFNATNRFYNETLPGWQTFSAWTSVYGYTTIDATPPNITHNNNTLQWDIGVSDTNPFPNVSTVKINTLVADEVTPVDQDDVQLYFNVNGTWYSKNMTKNSTTDHFYYWINYDPYDVISSQLGLIKYFIQASDQNATGPNTGRSQNYTLLIDFDGPQVTNITIDPNRKANPGDPDVVEYKDIVEVSCNITDVNPIGLTQMVWSATNFATNSSPIPLIHTGGSGYKSSQKIPTQAYGLTIKYAIIVEDVYGNHLEYVREYTVDDFTPPDVYDATQIPPKQAVGGMQRVDVSVKVDEDPLGAGIAVVWLQYIVNGNTTNVITVLMATTDNSTYTASIQGYAVGTTIEYTVIAIDVAGNSFVMTATGYQVIDIGVLNDPFLWILYGVLLAGGMGLIITGYVWRERWGNAKWGFIGGGALAMASPLILFGLGFSPIELSGLTLAEFWTQTAAGQEAFIWSLIIGVIVVSLAVVLIGYILYKRRQSAYLRGLTIKKF